MENFQLTQQLGAGGQGSTHAAIRKKDGMPFALKLVEHPITFTFMKVQLSILVVDISTS
jgi:hypothetical protein